MGDGFHHRSQGTTNDELTAETTFSGDLWLRKKRVDTNRVPAVDVVDVVEEVVEVVEVVAADADGGGRANPAR